VFTGIIEEMGTVRHLEISAAGASLIVAAGVVTADLKVGDSIAVSGPCLTVTAFNRESITVYVMPETLRKTTLKDCRPGQRVNLERAMALGGRLGGHLVSGHIDAVIRLVERKPEGAAVLLTFDTPENLLPYLVQKGSVALDGVSLTVIEVKNSRFTVGVIPHTGQDTTLGLMEVGSSVNLEVDLIGKYVEKMLQNRLGSQSEKAGVLTMDLLAEKGYL
jgi:riboflavin synthase